MILYKAIKYTILDLCLNSLLNGFKKNLATYTKRLSLADLRLGMRLKRLFYVYGGNGTGGEEYTDVFIDFNKANPDGTYYLKIYATHEEQLVVRDFTSVIDEFLILER